MSGEDVQIDLVGLSLFGPHGVTEAEREVGCRIVVDVSFTVIGASAVADDELGGTVDYGEVARLVTQVVRERSCHTLERLCALIADEIAERFEVADLEVRAAKPEPPMELSIDEVAVVLRRP